MIDKQIHRDELKLRLLLTDACTKNCEFCLNDFQQKGSTFLPFSIAHQAIISYTSLFVNRVPLQVYYSGGEPTLSDILVLLVFLAKQLQARTTLITNGDHPYLIKKCQPFLDCLHISAYEIESRLVNLAREYKASIQCLYPQHLDVALYYLHQDLPVKIFLDFYKPHLYEAYEEVARQWSARYPQASFRFTGIQENRGIGCHGCALHCITLKAIWVFPDGGVTACPQLFKMPKAYPVGPQEWREVFEEIYKFHKVV